MKTNLFARIAVAGVLVAATTVAFAGSRAVYQVTISDSGRWVNGTATDARGSADSLQVLGCYFNSSIANCYATNSAGLSRNCTTNNPALIEVIRHVTPESYIYFQWNPDGTCNYVLIENSSRFKPGSASGT